MSNELVKVFNFTGSDIIRTILHEDEPWFVAKDVAEVLGYSNTRDAISKHCKGCRKMRLPSASGEQDYTIIPERDVYRLIMRSKLPAAEKFEEWVVGEVLPAIRKTGLYNNQLAQFKLPQNYLEALESLVDQVKINIEQDKLLLEQKPKVEAYDIFLSAKNAITIGEYAKVIYNDIGLGRNNLFKKLRELGFLDKKNMPYQKYIDLELFVVREVSVDYSNYQEVKSQTLITTKGQDYLRRRLISE